MTVEKSKDSYTVHMFSYRDFDEKKLGKDWLCMNIVKGDLITLAKQGRFDVIVHGCNCFNNMGKGIADKIRKIFPSAYEADMKTKKGDLNKLGTITWGVETISFKDKDGNDVTKALYVVNAYTQFSYGGGKVNLDYEALERCFRLVGDNFSGKRIAFPRIGAGLARGDWNKISKIIMRCLKGEDIVCVEFSD